MAIFPSKILIRPLSVNEGYQGRRFKTPEHKRWQDSVTFLLPNNYKLPDAPYEVYYKFGFSSKSSDWDNCIKHFQDCLSEKYKFNDKLIRKAIIETEIVTKGNEFIEWELRTLK